MNHVGNTIVSMEYAEIRRQIFANVSEGGLVPPVRPAGADWSEYFHNVCCSEFNKYLVCFDFMRMSHCSVLFSCGLGAI